MSQSNQVIRYSRGSSKFDNKPNQKVAQTFDEFESEVLSDQSPEKGMAYICAPLNSGMHYMHPDKYEGEYHWRLKNHVCERNFLPFDCDWFASPEVFQELLLFSERYRGFGYTTASHQSTAPRARLIFAASRPVTRNECEEVCRAIQDEMLATLGRNNVKLDESVYRGEQPVYTPVYSSQTYHFNGCLVDVDALLNKKYGTPNQKAPGLITTISPHTGFDAPERVSDGEGREETILKYAGHIRAQNVPEELILKICLDYNQLHIFPPLDEATVLDRVNRYAITGTSAPLKDIAWITPEEIGSSLPPVPKFEGKLLPAGFREWVYDIAERMQCPIEFLAVGAMIAAGAAVGNKIGIQPKQKDTGWVEVPNLWGAIVGRPGVMKTPALAEVLGPVKKIESEMQDAFALTKSKYEFDRFLYDAAKKQLSSQIVKNGGKWSGELPQEPEQPQPQRIIVSDSTYQKLGQVLSGNPHGVLVFQDELSGLLKRLDSDGQDAARAFYLEAWNGKHSYTFDRVERGTIKIPRLSISLLGGLQPTKLFEYLRGAVTGGAGDDGLAQRFQLLVYPDIKNVWTQVDRPPDIEAADKANSIFVRLAKIDPLALGAVQHYPGAIPVLRFDQTAQEKFNNWWSLLENDLRSTTRHPALESHLSKYRKLVPAMALLHHLIEARPGQIGVESLDCALRWHILLFQHAERCYAGVTLSNREGARLLLKHIKGNALPDGFTVRDVYRKNWSSLSRKEDAIESIELLCDLGWLKGIRDERSSISDGRSTTRYFINPYVRSTP
jgi:putative DNA primase/helicase